MGATRSAARRRAGSAAVLVVIAMLAAGCSGAPMTFRGPAGVPMRGFTTILGPVTGTGPRAFVITEPRAVSFQLTCAGTSEVWLRTTPDIGGMGVQCPAGGSDWLNLPAAGLGLRVRVRVAAPAGTRWLLRIDGSRHAHTN